MKKMFIIISLLYFGCEDKTSPINSSLTFIASEGNFGSSNGSISVFRGQEKIQSIQNIGDVLQSITVHDDKLFAVVNNSHKIKVFTIFEDGLRLPGITIDTKRSGPRELIVHENKAYFTNYNTKDIQILNLETYYLEGSIKVDGLPESIVSDGENLWVAINMLSDYSSGTKVIKIDIASEKIMKIFEVGRGPQQLLIDNGTVWVSRTFYSPDFTESYFGTSKIDMKTNLVEIMNYGIGSICGGDLMSLGNRIYRTYEGGIVPLQSNLSLDKTSKVGSYNKNDLYSANSLDEEIYFGITSDYTAPDTVFVHDESGKVVRLLKVDAAPGDFAIWPK